jgi:hypothetical protein
MVMASEFFPLSRKMVERSREYWKATFATSFRRTKVEPSDLTTRSPKASGEGTSPVSLMEKRFPPAIKVPPGMLRC